LEADVGDFLGTGWTFPVKPDPSGRLTYSSGEELIQQSVRLILETAPGERVMRPDFGCGIHELVFEANTTMLHTRIQHRVKDALLKWERRIDVLNVRVESSAEEPMLLLIRIDYRVRANNSFFNLVYPFFLTEGVKD
jgi:phage baseplate assembly protein W